MQINIKVKLPEPLTIPIAYHYLEQSAIYNLIGGDLHDKGVTYGKRNYKLFTFGPFLGEHKVSNGEITFYDEIAFQIRCHEATLGQTIIRNLNNNGIRIGEVTYYSVIVSSTDPEIDRESVVIRAVAPICAYETLEDKHTKFYNPGDEKFYSLIEDNFARKYTAAFGVAPEGNIKLSVLSYNDRDKQFTNFKGFYIEAWHGKFRLEGSPEYIKFLFDTGLGCKNSQGFGLFDICG